MFHYKLGYHSVVPQNKKVFKILYFEQLVHSQELRLIHFMENGLDVRNISSILQSSVIPLCETTERYPTLLFKNVSPSAITIIPKKYEEFTVLL